jgi:hypothetical protein
MYKGPVAGRSLDSYWTFKKVTMARVQAEVWSKVVGEI